MNLFQLTSKQFWFLWSRCLHRLHRLHRLRLRRLRRLRRLLCLACSEQFLNPNCALAPQELLWESWSWCDTTLKLVNMTNYTWLQLRWWTRAPKLRVSVTGWEQDHADRCQHRSTWTSRECFFLSRSPPSFRLSPSRWLRGEKEEAMQCGYLIVGLQVFVELNGQSWQSSDCLAKEQDSLHCLHHSMFKICASSWTLGSHLR